eukprot:2318918-Rhodomonas_salina.1
MVGLPGFNVALIDAEIGGCLSRSGCCDASVPGSKLRQNCWWRSISARRSGVLSKCAWTTPSSSTPRPVSLTPHLKTLDPRP